jgi:hypothetical protein
MVVSETAGVRCRSTEKTSYMSFTGNFPAKHGEAKAAASRVRAAIGYTNRKVETKESKRSTGGTSSRLSALWMREVAGVARLDP